MFYNGEGVEAEYVKDVKKYKKFKIMSDMLS